MAKWRCRRSSNRRQRTRPGEQPVKNAPQPLRFLGVALLGIGALAWIELHEVMDLAKKWPRSSQLPHQPLDHASLGGTVLRPQLAGLLGEIEQDRSRLHEMEAVVSVNDGGDLVVRRDLEKVGLELLAFGDVDLGEPDRAALLPVGVVHV